MAVRTDEQTVFLRHLHVYHRNGCIIAKGFLEAICYLRARSVEHTNHIIVGVASGEQHTEQQQSTYSRFHSLEAITEACAHVSGVERGIQVKHSRYLQLAVQVHSPVFVYIVATTEQKHWLPHTLHLPVFFVT